MSQHKGAKGPGDRAVKIEAIRTKRVRAFDPSLPAHLHNLASREQRRGLRL